MIYALRSGLDQLAWQLALIGNPDPGRDTMFPIHENQSSRSEELFRKRVWDMPCEAVMVIKELQPYKRSDQYRSHPLWHLNELSNMDKHRLPAGRCTDANIYVEPRGYPPADLANGVEFSFPLDIKERVVLKTQTPTLLFGDPIDRTGKREPLELTRENIAEIYRYVREEVAPRFSSFLL